MIFLLFASISFIVCIVNIVGYAVTDDASRAVLSFFFLGVTFLSLKIYDMIMAYYSYKVQLDVSKVALEVAKGIKR